LLSDVFVNFSDLFFDFREFRVGKVLLERHLKLVPNHLFRLSVGAKFELEAVAGVIVDWLLEGVAEERATGFPELVGDLEFPLHRI